MTLTRRSIQVIPGTHRPTCLRWSKKNYLARPRVSQVSPAFAETLRSLQLQTGNHHMRWIRLYVAALAACLPICSFSAPATAAAPSSSTVAAVKAENARWAEAFGRGDYEAIGRLYTADGALLPPGGDRVTGSRAITEYFIKGYAASKPGTVSFSNYEFYGNEAVVTEVSDAVVRDQGGKITYRGKQILVFLKQGAAWKLHRDMWNDYAP
jgi:ketosteroid isomerase-like protein